MFSQETNRKDAQRLQVLRRALGEAVPNRRLLGSKPPTKVYSWRKSKHALLCQYTARPPLASKQNPVVKEHSLEAAKRTVDATSSNLPVRAIGILSVMYFTCSAGIASTIAVCTTAGATQLQVISFPVVA